MLLQECIMVECVGCLVALNVGPLYIIIIDMHNSVSSIFSFCNFIQIEATSTDILLEVTSSTNLATCKSVMDSLVSGMCESGVGVSREGVMLVEQVKVVEQNERQLLVLYPSRTDLTDYTTINVARPD